VEERPHSDEDRAERDRERSDEAHWQVAEEAAERASDEDEEDETSDPR
jgi:hypothetical protein